MNTNASRGTTAISDCVRPLHRQDDLGRDRRLYRLTLDRPPHNLQPRYNVCPTQDGKRDFVRMRRGLVPW
jgi:hypothetical protein